MNRAITILCASFLAAGLIWFFPLFHIIPLDEVMAKNAANFNAAGFVHEFWEKQLVPSLEQANDASEVILAIKDDPDTARKSFGKSVGIGRVYFYFLRGEGTILAVDKAGVAIDLIAPDDEADAVLKTGPLFGNAIRDATGHLKASDYANSQDFNAISRELNQIVQTEVQPILNGGARAGRRIRFVACAEVRASSGKLLPLTMVPVKVSFPE